MPKNKNAKIKSVTALTLGCSKNVVDSERFIAQLRANNINFTPELKHADALVINTCGFIKPAKEESVNVIMQASELRRKGLLKKLIVCGCLAERYQNQLKEQIPNVDHFFGINAEKEIMEVLSADYKYELLGERQLTPPHYTYLKIAEGCDHPCSFCAIPLIRGKYHSYPEDKLIKEASFLAGKGVREFNIIAQDSTYYGKDTHGEQRIAPLMDKLAAIDGVDWLRILYTYPTKFPEDLLDVIAANENICNYIDMPLQHISTDVLKSMRRGITERRIRELIETIRKKVPGVAIRSTFIVGYPDESEKEFNKLLNFIREAGLDRVGVFTYSQEEGTTAFPLNDPVPEDIKEERRSILMEAQAEVALKKNRQKIGKKLKVIVDNKAEGEFMGRTEHDAPEVDNAVYLTSDFSIKFGEFVETEITDADEYDLFGKAVRKL